MSRKAADLKRIKKATAAIAALGMAAVMTACSCAGSKAAESSAESAYSGTEVQSQTMTQTQPTTQSQAISNTIEWKGKSYTYNRNLDNILFLGIDRTDDLSEADLPGTAGQADCIMILSLDKETMEGRILQINRNTMTQIDLYDTGGNLSRTKDGQINLQYAYDIGGASSCWATKKTVSELLFGLQIDGYFALNLEGLAQINDAIGGVDVTMREDYTLLDADFAKGATVHLDGAKAERFVRYRDIEQFNSVQRRMERQADYVAALVGKAKGMGGSYIYDVLSPYIDKEIITDLDADQINSLRKYTYLTDEVRYLPGEMKMGDVYEEFYVDEDALQDLIIEMFYTQLSS